MDDTSSHLRSASISPRVSVIVIFFNAAKFLSDAIQSVISQTFVDWELILVDDGSTDGSTEIAKKYTSVHSKIHYVDHAAHRNLGMSVSRNAGIAIAQGEFVAFIDSDDIWLPTKLSEQISIMEMYPAVALVAGATGVVHNFDSEMTIVDSIEQVQQTGHIQNEIINPPEAVRWIAPLGPFCGPGTSDMLVRRWVTEYVEGFEDEFRGLGEDYAFVTKVALNFPVYFSSRYWYLYRRHAETNSAKMTRDVRTQRLLRQEILEWMERYARSCKTVTPDIRRAIILRLLPLRFPILDYPRRIAKILIPQSARQWLRFILMQGRTLQLRRRHQVTKTDSTSEFRGGTRH